MVCAVGANALLVLAVVREEHIKHNVLPGRVHGGEYTRRAAGGQGEIGAAWGAFVISTEAQRSGEILHLAGTAQYSGIMPGSRTYYVYILTSRSRTLYVGVTNNIKRRIWEHKQGEVQGFSRRYHIDNLVYVEAFGDVNAAIAREKQIKRWRREKKLRLIAGDNPEWRDLSDGWYD